MALVVADSSALVSLGTVAGEPTDPFEVLLAEHRVVLPERIVLELQETASFEDPSGDAARAVLDRSSAFEVRSTELEEEFPLDDGENAAVGLANELHARQLLCDEFNRLALIHVSLADTRLVTTPTLLIAFLRNDRLSARDAAVLLDRMSEARSWENNRYVARARATLERQHH